MFIYHIVVKHKYASRIMASRMETRHFPNVDRLKEIRKQRGLTQQQLADAVGTEQSVISRLESSGVGASLGMVAKIAEALNVEVSELFTPPEDYRRAIEAIESLPESQREAAIQMLEGFVQALKNSKN